MHRKEGGYTHGPGEQDIPCLISSLPAPEDAEVLRRDGRVLAVWRVVHL